MNEQNPFDQAVGDLDKSGIDGVACPIIHPIITASFEKLVEILTSEDDAPMEADYLTDAQAQFTVCGEKEVFAFLMSNQAIQVMATPELRAKTLLGPVTEEEALEGTQIAIPMQELISAVRLIVAGTVHAYDAVREKLNPTTMTSRMENLVQTAEDAIDLLGRAAGAEEVNLIRMALQESVDGVKDGR